MTTGTVLTKNRWLIEGTLITDSPLHIGDGGTTTRQGLVVKAKDGSLTPVEIAAVATNRDEHAYIPGTTLKGNLRAWARQLGVLSDLNEVFGYPDRDSAGNRTPGHGGSGEFWDAPAVYPQQIPVHLPPYWDAVRLAGVVASVSIARTTRTASDKRLFHHEFVPPGIAFNVGIAGTMAEAEVRALLALLESAKDGLSLGAQTGDGCGRVLWHLRRVRRLDADAVRVWLDRLDGVGYESLRDLTSSKVEAWRQEAAQEAARRAGSFPPRVEVDIVLKFTGPFLVNDPSRTKDEDSPDHVPVRDRDGRPFLPASSLRGTLRSHAERILRTLGGDRAACGEHLPGGVCHPPEVLADVLRLCPACRLFGTTGWRAPLEVSDFRSEAPVREVLQDFLAIDSFTGGGANHLKFDAQAAAIPVLQGTLALDIRALDRAGIGAWSLGLMALVLRDVHDGEVALGFGGGKGYGMCRICVRNLRLPAWEKLPESLLASMAMSPPEWRELQAQHTWAGPTKPLMRALDAWIKTIPQGGE